MSQATSLFSGSNLGSLPRCTTVTVTAHSVSQPSMGLFGVWHMHNRVRACCRSASAEPPLTRSADEWSCCIRSVDPPGSGSGGGSGSGSGQWPATAASRCTRGLDRVRRRDSPSSRPNTRGGSQPRGVGGCAGLRPVSSPRATLRSPRP
ncbi:hypothetical protein VTJ83DRAFT_5781 [Remersonia thermophila]|uniref:Uncharacterized protein n=1 Tax=Remersonia thermophila TaxID=72144 RepID=A0ABR4DA19_9PEZI